ncbi:MAG: 7-cyano-7-deazaguanine synthase [Anaerobutyricum sp.]
MPYGKKALIAMSGGVDSSVAAYLMKEAGYDCIGVTMKLYDNEDIGMEREKTCCSLTRH